MKQEQREFVYINNASVLHDEINYKRTVWTTYTDLGEIPVAEVKYMLWEVKLIGNVWVTFRSCRIVDEDFCKKKYDEDNKKLSEIINKHLDSM